ncbi:MAG: hypothetical protein DSZ03_04790 [Sulfurimonas sp.]|nr:MAG: hypothetical protein DSZ03_04790 [Sulfurimonas sp.]
MISSSLQAYHSNELRIQMFTSSGDDTISLNFFREQSLSLQYKSDTDKRLTNVSFSSMQSFQFHIESDGIDDQDKKEIEALMTLAQPFIDHFMNELSDAKQTTPLHSVTKALANLFSPLQDQSQNHQNYAKREIVKAFDTAAFQIESFENILQEAQRFLEEVLHIFDADTPSLYA